MPAQGIKVTWVPHRSCSTTSAHNIKLRGNGVLLTKCSVNTKEIHFIQCHYRAQLTSCTELRVTYFVSSWVKTVLRLILTFHFYHYFFGMILANILQALESLLKAFPSPQSACFKTGCATEAMLWGKFIFWIKIFFHWNNETFAQEQWKCTLECSEISAAL